MKTAQVIELKKSLASAVTANRTDDMKRILLRLRQELTATEEIIRDTKIGLSVGKLRTNANKEISELAKDIVKKWKNDVGPVRSGSQGAKSATASPKPAASPAPIAKSPAASTSTLSPKPESKPSLPTPTNGSLSTGKPQPERKPSVSIDKPLDSSKEVRSGKTDGITFDKKDDKTRDKCIELLYDALVLDAVAPSNLILERADEIENIIFKANGEETTPAYRAKMRSLYSNLKDKKNPGLRGAVVSGELEPKKLCGMSSADMASEEQKAHDRALLEKNLFNARGAGATASETDQFKCGRCKLRKCTYYQMQTRSADEPMTTFVTCVNCGNRWKFC